MILPPFRCLIVCPLPLVAEDLAEIIRERLGPQGAEICLDPLAASARLAEMPAGSVVFAVIRRQAVAETGLGRAVAGQGGRLVLVGVSIDPAEAEAQGWHLLPEPFSSEMVEAMLARLGG